MNKKFLCLCLIISLIFSNVANIMAGGSQFSPTLGEMRQNYMEQPVYKTNIETGESVQIAESGGAFLRTATEEEKEWYNGLLSQVGRGGWGASKTIKNESDFVPDPEQVIQDNFSKNSSSKKSNDITIINDKGTAETQEKAVEKPEFQSDVRVSIGSDTVMIGEKSFKMDAKPYIQASSSSTLVPLRFVTAALFDEGMADADKSTLLQWNGEDKTVTVKAKGKTVIFKADSGIMSVDGKKLLMANGVKSEIKDGRMYIPFRALGKALDITVDWDDESRTAIYRQK